MVVVRLVAMFWFRSRGGDANGHGGGYDYIWMIDDGEVKRDDDCVELVVELEYRIFLYLSIC